MGIEALTTAQCNELHQGARPGNPGLLTACFPSQSLAVRWLWNSCAIAIWPIPQRAVQF